MVEFIEPKSGYPNLLLLSGPPGAGKSTLTMGLNQNGHKCLVIDTQNGYNHIGGYVYSIIDEAVKHNTTPLGAFDLLIKDLKDKRSKDEQYDFISFDTLSGLKGLIIEHAARIYNTSLTGKAAIRKAAEEKYGKANVTPERWPLFFKEFASKDPVEDLGQNGWNYYYRAFTDIFTSLQGLAKHCLIFIAHTKISKAKFDKKDEELDVREIDFWPKILLTLIGEASDSGFVFRENNLTQVSFVLKANHENFKSRHFDGMIITLSEKKDGKIVYYWDKIFPFLIQKN
jgi:hypothetical protein